MHFVVLSNSQSVPYNTKSVCYLWEDNWNDWFEYKTLYTLIYVDQQGTQNRIGDLKIGQFRMIPGQQRPNLPRVFEQLSSDFFSVGQDSSYYKQLRDLGNDVGQSIATSLNDFASNLEIFKNAQNERVTNNSLLRSVTGTSIIGQFRRILGGGVELTEFHFNFTVPDHSGWQEPLIIDFHVQPESKPPTNIHVLIGRNGVGKSYILNAMSRAAVYSDKEGSTGGYFSVIDYNEIFETQSQFAGVISVSFSAFDDFPVIGESNGAQQTTRYRHMGLRKLQSPDSNLSSTKTPSELVKEFTEVVGVCTQGDRLRLWENALQTLQADPIFSEHRLLEVLANSQPGLSGEFFARLSSGHKIVLLIVSQLIANVEEKTLVLMDEPEAHLHPPLLAALVRTVSDLLISRNGVAIIATHSPVVLQEVPSHCVWKIVRHGLQSRADRLDTETFGESVGVLTRAVFGLEVTRSGFHKMLLDSASPGDSVDDVLDKFQSPVGSEGRALLASYIALELDQDFQE